MYCTVYVESFFHNRMQNKMFLPAKLLCVNCWLSWSCWELIRYRIYFGNFTMKWLFKKKMSYCTSAPFSNWIFHSILRTHPILSLVCNLFGHPWCSLWRRVLVLGIIVTNMILVFCLRSHIMWACVGGGWWYICTVMCSYDVNGRCHEKEVLTHWPSNSHLLSTNV